ncbi:non-ribosomal peptide synthetase [Aspergillus affinis]|uniref:non-ribosomal peptide synthetase n=1 Tax=Aspergillus affinis TaxID=1070780 RepID=UPI0022FE83DE|nr:Thioesterase domain-containing protein [Aspergillus affinis]KAI9036326.1 Thioesterase domain-containing protein [Aspergillus affinis]
MTVQTLNQLLSNAASSSTNREVVTYPSGSIDKEAQRLTYGDLYTLVIGNGNLLRNLNVCSDGSIVLLHFENHLDNIIWLWSVIHAGCVPAMSTGFPKSTDSCKRHLCHLNSLLDNPVCLTSSNIRSIFPSDTDLNIIDVETLGIPRHNSLGAFASPLSSKPADTALLMLTSGSTGLPKAVCLTHGQIIASLQGKCAILPVKDGGAFLNWIRLDHVGSLIEIHLLSLFTGTDQVHVQPEDIVSEPSTFLRVIERHHVARTFAPNFFLAELERFFDSAGAASDSFNLSSLQAIVSGGEGNVVSNCSRVSRRLQEHGAPSNVIVPAFGMTETCAGSIYNLSFPSHDLEQKYEFASVGYGVPGIEVRITSSEGALTGPGEVGNLELKGPAVFSAYHNDLFATEEAFTSDRWFKTGDMALTDKSGRLVLVGRTKHVISINGVKYYPQTLEAAIEDAGIEGVTGGDLVCFSQHSPGAPTEAVCIMYVPRYPNGDLEARHNTMKAIGKAVFMITNSHPIVLPVQRIERSALGKIERSVMSRAFENGQFQVDQMRNAEMIERYQRSIYLPPENNIERIVLEEVADALNVEQECISATTNIFEMGLTSISLIKLQRCLQRRLALVKEVPVATIITHSTVRRLAVSLQEPDAYTPFVPLQIQGKKPPLWLIHPAAGEALVFLNLAKQITDRPVFSFRARGFIPGEPYFSSLEECISIYYSNLKKQQPQGPYCIMGYSYGAMLAFEIGKILEQNGDEVRFLASVNRPPHVHPRLQQVQWSDCLLNLAYFVDVITEDVFRTLLTELAGLSKVDAITRLIHSANASRLSNLALDEQKLENWANVTFSLQEIARKYQPKGSVEHLDIFYCDPLEMVGATKEEWLQRLGKWQDFSRKKIKYYGLPGKHHDVFGPRHVRELHKSLEQAMMVRGV